MLCSRSVCPLSNRVQTVDDILCRNPAGNHGRRHTPHSSRPCTASTVFAAIAPNTHTQQQQRRRQWRQTSIASSSCGSMQRGSSTDPGGLDSAADKLSHVLIRSLSSLITAECSPDLVYIHSRLWCFSPVRQGRPMPCCDCITRSLFLGCSDGGVQWHMRQLSSTDLVKLDSAGPAAEPVCGPVHKWHDCPWVCSVDR